MGIDQVGIKSGRVLNIVNFAPIQEKGVVLFCKAMVPFLWIDQFQSQPVIGASLSKPHTSVTALRTCVCIYLSMLVWTDHLP